MTGSDLARTSADSARFVAISRNYSGRRLDSGEGIAQFDETLNHQGHEGTRRYTKVHEGNHKTKNYFVNLRGLGSYGFLTAGALKYFSMEISKYIISVPFASCTPVRKKLAPARGFEMSWTSKNRKPRTVVCGSTAFAPN